MRRIFSIQERKKLFSFQQKLLIEDLESSLIMLKEGRMRGAYIFLFDALERVFDSFFLTFGIKPSTRKDREELVSEHFSFLTFRKYRQFYYGRRGGMYEEPLFITSRDLKKLLDFLMNLVEEVQKRINKGYGFDKKVPKLLEDLRRWKK